MAENRFREPVSYRPFHMEPVLQEGLLAVPRFGGELEGQLASSFARLASGLKARAEAQQAAAAKAAGIAQAEASRKAGLDAALSGGPGNATIDGGGPELSGPLPKGGEERLGRIVARLKERGWSAEAAAGIAGHAVQESSLNPEAIGDNGTSGGLWQWRGERLTALKRFAKSRGAAWTDFDTQVDFLDFEVRNSPSERRAFEGLKAAKSVDDAALAMMHFERPRGYTPNNPAAGHGWKNRLANARRAASATGVPTGAVKPGTPGSFRPTGDRNYDAAAGDYLKRLDLVLDQDIAEVYDKFGDDPAVLEQRFADLKRVHQADVYPEIQTDYDSAFYTRTQKFIEQSRRRADERAAKAADEEFAGRTTALETERDKRLTTLDPASPGAADEVARVQTKLDAQYDAAVESGRMTPEAGAKAKAESRRAAAVSWYERQADALASPQDVRSLRKRIGEDHAAGRVSGIDDTAWAALDGRLKAIEVARATDGLEKLTEAEISARVDSLLPADGDAADDAVHAEVERKANAVVGRRRRDPAAAVDDAFAPVAEAKAALDPNRPETYGHLAELRMSVQAELDIPEAARRPLTVVEARELVAGIDGQPDPFKAMRLLAEDIQAKYGDLADDVLTQVAHTAGVDQELAAYSGRLIKELGLGNPAAAAAIQRQADAAAAATRPDKAMDPPWVPGAGGRPAPNTQQIQHLLSNPELAADFDRKFGKGASDVYFTMRQKDRAAAAARAAEDQP